MCNKVGIKWYCGHHWIGWLPCDAPSPACEDERNRSPIDCVGESRTRHVKRSGRLVKLLWCCSPGCCQAKLDTLATAVIEAGEIWRTTPRERHKKAATEYSTWSDYNNTKKNYKHALGKHVDFCVNCFVEGLGRSPKMCEEMGDQFVFETPVRMHRECMFDIEKERRFETSSATAQLLSLYEQLISRSEGIQGVTCPSVQHFQAIKEYTLNNYGTCESGWPLKCVSWSIKPETWRQKLNHTDSPTAGPSQVPGISSPASFDTLTRHTTPALERAIVSIDGLTQQKVDQTLKYLDQLRTNLYGPGALKVKGQIFSEELLQDIMGQFGMLMKFEALNLELLDKVWFSSSTSSLKGLEQVDRFLRFSNKVLKFERDKLHEWCSHQPPPVQSRIAATVSKDTADLEDRLQRIEKSPDARTSAIQLHEEFLRMESSKFGIEQEESEEEESEDGESEGEDGEDEDEDEDEQEDEEIVTDNADEGLGPPRISREIDQVLWGQYDPNAGREMAIRPVGKTYAKLAPK